MTPNPPDILARIVVRKREELAAATLTPTHLRAQAESQLPHRRDFAAALRSHHPAIIAEIKKASPSKGILSHDFNPPALARQYEQGGAAALSVLTDRDFFHGGFPDLEAARAACHLPVIRKDFTIADYHVLEAAAHGADAILLIVAILDLHQLIAFRQLAAEFKMAALVEVHNQAELETALRSGAEIVGVNNRDLRTFNVSLQTSIQLATRIPGDILKVSESGIFSAADIARLNAAGFNAFLVGEHLVKSGDPTEALRSLRA